MKSNSISSSSQDFSFTSLIPKQLINDLCSGCLRFRAFDPSSTLFCFLYQVINLCSTKTALLNLNFHRVKNNLKPVSMNTAALTKAKKRLCEEKLKNMALKLGEETDRSLGEWKFKGHDIYLGDGTVLNLEDTEDNKKEFPVSIRRGMAHGLPKMRLLCLFSASSGCFINGKIGSYCGKGQAETTLLKSLLTEIKKNSVLVLDRYFTNHKLRELIANEQIHYVIRSRDKNAKQILKKRKEKIVEDKSGHKVRYIKSSIKRPGFRVATMFIMTNLIEKKLFSKEDIETIYLKRWGAELDIRHLKETLRGTLLRSKSSDMVRKEAWVHLIAYNLVRRLSGHNSKVNGKEPRKQSFKIYIEVLLKVFNGAIKKKDAQILTFLEGEILDSKYRCEPRAVKRRNLRYEPMIMSRKEAKKLKWGNSGRRHRAGLLKAKAS